MALREDWFPAEKLHRAAADGDVESVRELVKEIAALDAFDDIGYTPLHYAVKHEQFEIVELLLDAGANINAHEEATISDTAIAVAAEECSPQMVELLLQRGADPSISGWMGLDAHARARQRNDGFGPLIENILKRCC